MHGQGIGAGDRFVVVVLRTGLGQRRVVGEKNVHGLAGQLVGAVEVLLFAREPMGTQEHGKRIRVGNTNGYRYSIFTGVLGLLGKRVPVSLKVFLVAFAIVDSIINLLLLFRR